MRRGCVRSTVWQNAAAADAAATAAATLDCDTTSDMTSMRWVAATNDLSPTCHTSAAARSAARTTQPSMQQQPPYAGRRLVVAKDQLTTSLLMRPYRNCLSQHNAVAIVKQRHYIERIMFLSDSIATQ